MDCPSTNVKIYDQLLVDIHEFMNDEQLDGIDFAIFVYEERGIDNLNDRERYIYNMLLHYRRNYVEMDEYYRADQEAIDNFESDPEND